jgi:predicted AAA+ superfamily ATPase
MAQRTNILQFISANLSETPTLARERTSLRGVPLNYRRAYSRFVSRAEQFRTKYSIRFGDEDYSQETKILLMPGLRGVGKTTVLFQLYQYLINEMRWPRERVLYFSADESTDYLGAQIYDIISVFTEDVLHTSLINIDQPTFILVDEAHYDRDWDLAAKMISDKTRNIFLLLTGSSALDMEMGADLARRAEKQSIFPLNFSEYLLLKHDFYPPKGTANTIRECLFSPADTVIDDASKLWGELKTKLFSIGSPLEKEFERYLSVGGFPFGIHKNFTLTYEWTFGIIDKIIDKDLLTRDSFKAETKENVTRIIYFLALKKPGATSVNNLAKDLQISNTSVSKILSALEKTHLIFSVKPLGGTKTAKKPWKYYFSSPALIAAIRAKLGRYDPTDADTRGLLAETLVASYFFRLKEVIYPALGCFYDPQKKDETDVDFLVAASGDNIIPIEVSSGEKDNRQITASIKKHHADYGIVISNRDEMSQIDKIIRLPLVFFSFV